MLQNLEIWGNFALSYGFEKVVASG